MKPIRILLADDHQIVLEGLKMILEVTDRYEVVGEANNGVEVLDFLDEHHADIVILDINMPKMDGITCSTRIKAKHAHVKVIVLTMFAEQSYLGEIVKSGIDGCLLKNNSGKELTEAIERVHSGRSYYDHIHEFTNNSDVKDKHNLTAREIEIIRSISEGLISTEIAEKLFISPNTVKTHRKNILKKLDLHSSSELIQYALNHGLI